MTTPYIDPNLIFAENAPTQDKPPRFDNYDRGMDETRKNNGRPTIKQLNYLHQQTDLKILYIHENGAGLPYVAGIDYQEGALILKDGQLVQKSGDDWVSIKTKNASELETANSQTQQEVNDSVGAKWYAKEGGYPLNARVMLENGDIVRNTVANNTNNPNSDLTGWITDGLYYKQINSVSELASVDVFSFNQVFSIAYYDGGDKRGGGYFYYDALDTTSTVDNIFIFASSGAGRWKRKLDDTVINTAQAGILNDGSDQGAKIQALFDAAVNASMMYGYTWRITIDGLEQRVWSSIPLTCNLTLLKLKDIWINSTISNQSSISLSGVAVTFVGSDSWVVNKPDTWRRKLRSKALDNVTIYGSSKTNTVGVLFKPQSNGNFTNFVFDGLAVNGFSYDLVLSSDCFLMSFDNCEFTGATERIFTYASNIGLAERMVNMGENIRFNSCVFANSRSILDLNYESWIYFDKCSFDYVGKSTDVEGWFKLTSNVGLDFHSCHFEAGNANSQLGKYMFYTTASNSSVNIFGGTFVFGGSLNNNDHVFYSTNTLNGNFQVDGLWCFTKNLAKKSWSNTKMGRFKIYTNTGVALQDVNASGLQAINKSITKDPSFIKSVLLNTPYDFWFVNGLDSSSTNQLINANITPSFGNNSDSLGDSYNSLKINVRATEQALFCLVKRKDGPKSNMSPVVRLSHFASRAINDTFIRFLPVDVKFTRNAQGVEVPSLDFSRWSTVTLGFYVKTLVNTSKSETTVYSPFTRSFSNIDSFEYFLVQINFTGNVNFDYIVTGLECYEVDV